MSKAEDVFGDYWISRGYNEIFPFVRQYRFHPTRRFLLDFANIEYKLDVEISGWSGGGGHGGSRKSFISDVERSRNLALLGWTYFPILASDCTKRVDVAAIPVIEWINKYTPVKIKVGW